MNLPEYRRALATAHERFAKAIAMAAEELNSELRSLDGQFFDDPDDERKAVARDWPPAENVPAKRR